MLQELLHVSHSLVVFPYLYMSQECVPAFFSSLDLLATRPQTVQRDEVLGVALGVQGARTVSVPDHTGQRVIYVERGDLKRVYAQLFEQLTDVDGWKTHLRAYQVLLEAFRTTTQLSDLVRVGDRTAGLKAYRAWVRALELFSDFILAPFMVERDVDPLCYALVKQQYGQDAERVWGVIASPSELHEFQRMRLAIVEAVIEGNCSRERAQSLADAFGWYNEYAFVEPLLDAKHFLGEMKALSLEEARAEEEKILQDVREHREAFEVFLATCSDATLKQLAEVVHAYTFLRTDRVDRMKETQVHLRRVFDMVANALREETGVEWTREMVAACTKDELLAYMEEGTIPYEEHIRERAAQRYVYYSEGGRAHVLHSQASLDHTHELIQAGQQQRQDIKGRPAFPGSVTGRVALIFLESTI